MYSQIASNKRKTVLIMILFVLFVGLMGFIFAGFAGNYRWAPVVLVIALLYAVFMYYVGSGFAMSVNGAIEIQKTDNPRLWRIVENVAITDGLPMPRVFIINDQAPNACATGRDPEHASVCVTAGLMDIMNDTELESVIAHELGHVKNYDIRVAMISFALVAVVGIIADIMIRMSWFGGGRRNNNSGGNDEAGLIFFAVGIIGAILAPVIAGLIQLAISRQREYLADATSALTTRYPEGLISALEKIGDNGGQLKRQNPSTAHMFFANPLHGRSLSKLFSTHPPIEARIDRLKKMESQA